MGVSSLCDGVAAGLAKGPAMVQSLCLQNFGGSSETVDNRLVEGQEWRSDGHGPNQ